MKLKPILLALAACSLCSANAQQFWRTDGTSGTWTGSNWGASAVGPFSTAYTSNANVQFTADSTVTFVTNTSIGNVTVADNRTVTVSQAGTMGTNGAVRTFDIGAGSTLTWSAQGWSTVAGVGFIKNGAGIWNIGAQSNALNTTNGGFTLNAGTVIVGGNNSFGGSVSVLNINGGTIQSSGTRAYANSAITIGGNFTNTGTGNATFSGTVALGAATRTITNDTTSGSRIYSGVISGTSGSGLTFAGSGAGQTYIGNASNSFTGTISITGSEVGFANNGAFGNAANTIVIDGGRLSSASTSGGAVTYTLASTHGIQVGSAAGTSISTVSGGVLTYDGVISDKTASTGAWAKQGSGTLELGGASTYTGNTSINNGNVKLTTGNDRLPTGTVVSIGQAASANLGTLDLNGRNQQIAGLDSTTGTNATASNNVVNSATAATLTIGGAGTYSYGDGTNANSGVITDAISLVKNGDGTQTLGDANTYTGTTTINGGILAVNGSLASGSAVTVNSGGTLGGSGTVNGTVTVKNGGIVGPGNSPGVLTTGAASFENSSIFSWELSSDVDRNGTAPDGTRGTNYDGLTASSLSVASGAVFRVVLTGTASSNLSSNFWDTNQTWNDIFSGSGATTNSEAGKLFNAFQVYNGSTDITTSSALQGSFSFTNSTLNWTAVPEPSSALAGLLIAAGLLRRRRVA